MNEGPKGVEKQGWGVVEKNGTQSPTGVEGGGGKNLFGPDFFLC